MPKRNRWEDREIVKFNYGLSAEAPIYVDDHVYPECSELRDMHYGVEFGIVLRGKVRRSFGDYQMDLGAGEVWFCGFWEPHSRELLSRGYGHVYLIILPQLLSQMYFEEAAGVNWLSPFSSAPEDRPQVREADRKRMLGLGRQIQGLIGQEGRLVQVRLRVLLLESLLLLFENWQGPRVRRESQLESYAQIHAALELVLESRRYIPTQEAAKACRMSLNSFNRSFQQLMGIHFSKFALRSRLVGAAKELIQTELSPKAVALRWGFTDMSHLHRCFMDHYQCSPREYRERYRN